jgi:hypothetical protein
MDCTKKEDKKEGPLGSLACDININHLITNICNTFSNET